MQKCSFPHTHGAEKRKGGKTEEKGAMVSGYSTAIGLVQIGPLRVANCAPRPPKKEEVSQKPKLPTQSTFTIIQMQKGVGGGKSRKTVVRRGVSHISFSLAEAHFANFC